MSDLLTALEIVHAAIVVIDLAKSGDASWRLHSRIRLSGLVDWPLSHRINR